eukprot:13014786-Heterocapsa_arctica.AAC.1
MTISHNGVIACEEVIQYSFIDYIYIRTASGGAWLLYDCNLAKLPIYAVGKPNWAHDDVTYGQQKDAYELYRTYQFPEDSWPCYTVTCSNCTYNMLAGYTVCMSCRCPFILEALMGSEKRCIKGPLAAAAKVAGTGTIPKPVEQPGSSSSSKVPRSFTPTQLAKAEQGCKSL